MSHWDMAFEDTRLEGIEIGAKNERLKIAAALKKEGVDINIIAKATNLPLDTILKL